MKSPAHHSCEKITTVSDYANIFGLRLNAADSLRFRGINYTLLHPNLLLRTSSSLHIAGGCALSKTYLCLVIVTSSARVF